MPAASGINGMESRQLDDENKEQERQKMCGQTETFIHDVALVLVP
jgi:hypothetical protein